MSDRLKTQLQETGRCPVDGMAVAAITQIISDLGLSPYSVWVTKEAELVAPGLPPATDTGKGLDS